jgi:nitroreductase
LNPTIEALLAHRSVRTFTGDPVPDEHVRAAVEAGQRASTSSAMQAYAVLRVRDASRRERLVGLTGGQTKVARAPVFLVVCADTRRHRLACARAGAPYAGRLEAFLVAVIDAALFAQNVAVAFESLGYGLCFVGGLRNHLDEADRLLGTPEGVYPLFGLCVGRPAETPSRRPRLPLDAVLLEERYPDDASMLARLDAYDGEYREWLRARGSTPRAWSEAMREAHAEARRPGLAAHYRAKGADLT